MTADMQRLAVDISLLNQDPDRALKLAQEAVTADSKDYRDYLWLAQVLAAGGRPAAEVEEKLRRAVALADEVPETWVALVQHLAQAGRKQDAEGALKDARAKLKADRLPLALAACYESLGQNDQAQQQFAAALAARPGEVATLQAVAGYQLRRGRLAEAEPLLRKVAERRVPASDAEIAWARRNLALALAGGGDRRRFPEALSLVGLDLDASGGVVEKTRPNSEDAAEELCVRAQVLAVPNTAPLRARAIAILEQLNARHALTAADQFRLAQLYEASRAWPKARELLRSLAAAQGQNPIVLAQYARALLRHRQIDDAEGYVERLV
jgi:lipopolysaccharide biosynthesis regulator YciM